MNQDNPLIKSNKKAKKQEYGNVYSKDGINFHLKDTHTLKNGKIHYYWQCQSVNSKCPCRIVTEIMPDGTHKEIKYSGFDKHNHDFTGLESVVKKAKLEIKETALSQPTLPTYQVVNNTRANVSTHIQVHLPEKQTLARVVRYTRQKNDNFPRDPQSLDEIEIPNEFTTTYSRDPLGGPEIQTPFLFFDSGSEEENDRFLIFSTNTLLYCLTETKTWLVDGTFKVTPNIFYQLLVIHAYYETQKTSFPCVYILLPNKREDIYTSALSEVQNLVRNHSPDIVLSDFEIGLLNAIENVFPNTNTAGCYFHLNQSIKLKIAEFSLKNDVRDNEEYAKFVSMLRAIAFLPKDDVIDGFVELSDVVKIEAPALLSLFNYFERTYIGRLVNGVRRTPIFAIEMWNVNERTLGGLPRTNNLVEGAHNRLHRYYQCDHPSFFKFLKELKVFLRNTEADLFDMRSGKKVGRDSQKWAIIENRKISLLNAYDKNDIINFLTNMGATLMSIN